MLKFNSKIEFYKYSGSGNDFVIIDNRKGMIKTSRVKRAAIELCDRKNGIGGDGLLLLENSNKADFKMQIINSDGSVAEMCGNGARCIAHFAWKKNIVSSDMKFETLAGIIDATVKENDVVKVKLTDPFGFKDGIKISYKNRKLNLHFINTGVPHTIMFVNNLEKIDVRYLGHFIRFHKKFQPAGTNVDFVKVVDKHNIIIRTYERGVEDETLACGTGATASALISSIIEGAVSPVKVKTRGGETLKVYFDINGDEIKDVYLEGKVTPIFDGWM